MVISYHLGFHGTFLVPFSDAPVMMAGGGAMAAPAAAAEEEEEEEEAPAAVQTSFTLKLKAFDPPKKVRNFIYIIAVKNDIIDMPRNQLSFTKSMQMNRSQLTTRFHNREHKYCRYITQNESH